MACYCLSKKLFSVIIEYHYLLSFYTEIISQLSLPSLGMVHIRLGVGNKRFHSGLPNLPKSQVWHRYYTASPPAWFYFAKHLHITPADATRTIIGRRRDVGN